MLLTKLHPPPLRQQTIERARLVRRLHAEPGTKLTIVAAPAGSGKTTLLGTWRELEEPTRPVAWLTLDAGDDDPVVLWSYILAALRRALPAMRIEAVPEQVGPARILDQVLPELINALAVAGDASLVLDDFHRLSAGPARESIAAFAEASPASFQLVLACRSEPAFPLAAMRAHGTLLEVRAEELGFTSDEATTLLNDRLGLGLEREYVDDLVARTEGWAAGLYLAALSLGGVEDRNAFVSSFGGASRHVLDFLVDEVLEAHEHEAQELMLRSSVLERLSGPLCDALLERRGSAALLDTLSRTNLFLVPLDDRGEWYRFHHLFAQLLRVELEHRSPGLAPALHRRAFEWCLDHGLDDAAIGHALEAGAFDQARDVIAGIWLDTLRAGRQATVIAWLGRVPRELVRSDRVLLLVQAWTFALTGRHEEAEAELAVLEDLGWPDGQPLPDGSTSFEDSALTIRAAFPGGDIGEGYRNAVRAIELRSPESDLWPAACWPLGRACYYRGDVEAADRWFAEAAELAPSNALWMIAASSLAYRSLIAGDTNRLEDQERLAEQAVALASEHVIEGMLGEVHVALGVSIAARGAPVEALPSFMRGTAVLRSLERPVDLAAALIRQASALHDVGDHDGARAAVEEARAAIDSCKDPGVLPEKLAEITRARARVRPQDPELSERELGILRMLNGPLSERDIGRELYLSHNTVHSHAKSIYKKLGVSSRAQALVRARERELL